VCSVVVDFVPRQSEPEGSLVTGGTDHRPFHVRPVLVPVPWP
jgi:hypothetical protein